MAFDIMPGILWPQTRLSIITNSVIRQRIVDINNIYSNVYKLI